MPAEGAVPVVAVAASGGRDSTALLHAVAHAARRLGLAVVALHVHHGLNRSADDWLRHLRRQCARWRRAGLPVAFDHRRLAGAPAAGQSVEAWARAGRYAALADMARAHGASLVLLAHHRRDQAETVLLQALRGAGPPGLAGMPANAHRAGLVWARPWRDQPAERVANYVVRHGLQHVEDESNLDTRFDRNRMRHAVWPTLVDAFPHAESSLCQVARHAQRAAELAQEMAAADLSRVHAPDGALLRAEWLALSGARRWGALQAWLQDKLPDGVPDALLHRLLDELPGAASGASWPAPQRHALRLYRGQLQLRKEPLRQPAAGDAAAPSLVMDLQQPGRYQLPGWRGHIVVSAVPAGGIAVRQLAAARVRPRQAGDQFQSRSGGIARSLKKQFQAHAVPAWLRGGPVLEDASGQIIWVAGLGPEGRVALPNPEEPQRQLAWEGGAP